MKLTPEWSICPRLPNTALNISATCAVGGHSRRPWPKNLGEVLLSGERSKLNVTTDLQTFGLIVTAEPYFAVTQPSDVVVMENIIRNDTQGTYEEYRRAKYELLQRGQYVL